MDENKTEENKPITHSEVKETPKVETTEAPKQEDSKQDVSQTVPVKKKDDYVEIPIGKYLEKMRNNPWRVSTFVFAIILMLVLVFNPLGSPQASPGVDGAATVAPEIAGQNVLAFIQSNPNLDGEVTLVGVAQEGSFYQAVLNYQGQDVPVFITLDGKYMLAGPPISLSDKPIIPLGNTEITDTGSEEAESTEETVDDEADADGEADADDEADDTVSEDSNASVEITDAEPEAAEAQ